MINIGFDQQQRILGADGSVLWVGGQVLGMTFMAKNVSAGAYAATGTGFPGALIPLGSAVLWATGAAGANTVVPRLHGVLPAGGVQGWLTADPNDMPQQLIIGGTNLNSDRASNVNFMGVSQEPIAFGKSGVVAGNEALTTVRCTATAIAVGALVGGTDGATGANTQGGANTATGPLVEVTTTAGRILGVCVQTNTTAAAGTGSTGHVGIVVRKA